MHTEDGLWNSMDGNGAKWHHTMEMDMAYYVWKRSQMASYNGIRHGILWMETEPGMYFSHRMFLVTTFIRYGFGIAWMEMEPNGIT